MKICIVKLSAMGDIIHAMVVLQFIKKQLSHCQIDWIVEEGFKGVLEHSPHIDNILPVNLKSIKKRKLNIIDQVKLLNTYAKNQYDIVIDAQGLIKSAIVAKIVGGRVVGSKIVGFDKDSTREGIASWFYDDTVNIGYEKNVIDRNIKVLCESLRVEVSKDDILNKEPFLYSEKFKIQNSKLNIIFIVGASKPNKMYPKEKFLELAKELKDEKIEVIWANDEEKQIAKFLAENSPNVTICEKLSLNNLKFKIYKSKLIIGADTGPTHMAWALNIPSITIFGPTPAYRNTYETSINKTIKSDTKVDPLKLDYEDYSINKIDPKDIANLAKELL